MENNGVPVPPKIVYRVQVYECPECPATFTVPPIKFEVHEIEVKCICGVCMTFDVLGTGMKDWSK